MTAAHMYLFYGLAVVALDGVAFTEQYHESRLSDPAILDFIKRIEASVDAQIESMGPPFRHAARVCLQTKQGHSFESLILDRRGSPENPLKPEEIEYKFRHVVGACLSKARIDQIIKVVSQLDKLTQLNELFALLGEPVHVK